MNILHLVRTFDLSGRSKMIRDLCAGLAPRFESAVVCLTGRAGFKPEGLELVDLGLPPRGFSLQGALKLARLVGRRRVSIVHSHGAGAAAYAAGARLMQRHSRLVHTVHRSDGDLVSHRAVARSAALKAMDCVVAVSAAARDAFCDANAYSPDKVQVIHNGIDVAAFAGKGGGPRTTDHGPRTLVSVANFSRDKDFETLLSAFRIVRAKRPDIRLILVGDGPRRREIEAAIVDMGLADAVTVLGFREDVAALLADGDVFVHAAKTEGLGIAALEAMAAGVPVVVTAVGGLTEIVEHEKTGLLVESGNPRALADAVLRLLSDRALREHLAVNVSARLQSDFAIGPMCAAYASVYRRLMQPTKA